MPSSARRLSAAAAALAVLAGCRTIPPPPPSAPWEVRRPQLQALEHFVLQGRVAVANGSQGFNANLYWIEDGARAQVVLAGPLGAGAVHITATGTDLSIDTPQGAHLDSEAAHAEVSARLGFDPPLASLRYWVLGVPDPGAPATEVLDPAQQRLQQLTQSGWQIDYGGYGAFGAESLPVRLSLQREALRVRLLVDDWRL